MARLNITATDIVDLIVDHLASVEEWSPDQLDTIAAILLDTGHADYCVCGNMKRPADPTCPHHTTERPHAMSTYVRTVAPIVCRHIVDGVPEPADVPVGTLCILVGDEEAAGTFMLVVDDPSSELHGDECWNVPKDLFAEVNPT